MKKTWSLSTTVRNPERILPFLRVLKEMDGEEFDELGQVKFQTLLIQNRLYQPMGLSDTLSSHYETLGDKMSLTQAEEIFEHMKSRSTELQNDNGLRGRTSVAPLTKMGLAIAKKTSGKVLITDLGNSFLDGEIDISDVYFRFFIKWQIPNPESKDYAQNGQYDIKPFIGALHLINKVNQAEIARGNKDKGLSKDEFSLFVPSLVHHKDINPYAEEIISLRDLMEGKSKQEQKDIFSNHKKDFASRFLETDDQEKIEDLLSNLKDYGDNALRYFRLTRYIYVRGNGYYIDLQSRRSVEITNLLQHDDAKALEFSSKEEYLEYITDISKPVLPWETAESYKEIIKQLLPDISDYETRLGVTSKDFPDFSSFDENALKDLIKELRVYRRELQEKENHQQSQNIDKVKEYILALENIYELDSRPIALEKYTSLGLNALNDAIEIKPNYPVGDDNEPTFTAPANTPDIECYYQSHNAICEVTMLTSRDQWYNEGQPVMRHLRDFEDKDESKTAYCLFIAPTLHRDTMNTFWSSVKHEYEGKAQKIVPLTISQFVELLKTLVELKENGTFLEHTKLFELYEGITSSSSGFDNASEWLQGIPNLISSWKSELVS